MKCNGEGREGEIKLEQEDFQLLTERLEIIEDERMSYNIYPPDPLRHFRSGHHLGRFSLAQGILIPSS